MAGALWIALAGWLRQYRGINETISSLLLAYIALGLFRHLVEGPLRDPGSLNKPSTFALTEGMRLNGMAGSDVQWGLVVGVLACVAAGTWCASAAGQCAVLIITRKFREVMTYKDDAAVLRRGRATYHCAVASTDTCQLARAMMGEAAGAPAPLLSSTKKVSLAPILPKITATKLVARTIALEVRKLQVLGDRGTLAVNEFSLAVHVGEILGIAGVSGNGQRELVQALVGQRSWAGGRVDIAGQPYTPGRRENHRLKVRSLPEEPLRNACVGDLSVAENMALRDFDRQPLCRNGRLQFAEWRRRARQWIDAYGIKTQSEDAPLRSLSGGNVQRVVLARELDGAINVLIAANPVFGLDFAAVEDIHARLRDVRDQGAAVLLISEDLDELLELADRIVVMSEGRLVFETLAEEADRQVLGAHMGGGYAAHASGLNPELVL